MTFSLIGSHVTGPLKFRAIQQDQMHSGPGLQLVHTYRSLHFQNVAGMKLFTISILSPEKSGSILGIEKGCRARATAARISTRNPDTFRLDVSSFMQTAYELANSTLTATSCASKLGPAKHPQSGHPPILKQRLTAIKQTERSPAALCLQPERDARWANRPPCLAASPNREQWWH